MTYDTDGLAPFEEKVSPVQKIVDSVVDVFNSLLLRTAVVFLVGALASPFVADFIYPAVTTSYYTDIAKRLADDMNKKIPAPAKILQAMSDYNLAWYYVAGVDGQINEKTKPYAPDLPRVDNDPGHAVTWREKRYYEAVAPIGNAESELLHVGFYTGPVMAPAVGLGGASVAVPAPLAFTWVVVAGVFVLTAGALIVFVINPLGLLSRACTSLLLARDAYSGVTGGGLDVSGAVTEVKKMGLGLKEIRRQYDEQVAARVSREEELRRQRTTFEQEKKSLTKEYEEQLTQTQQKISELYTKEAEEEFINSLGREIDSLKSSQQIGQRILDKLNDKFPTSIIFGAFFKSDKIQRFYLDAFLGFDDRSVQTLRNIDHSKVAREVFSSGKYITLANEAIAEYGLVSLAQANAIKTIIYLPLTFQNRNLGMLAIYFNTEGQTVQERLRVLRNVVELTSRSLYQVVLYEEELEAARTDPLTGLRNKKYFYEVMPQVLDRASINPDENQFSILIMDGDHFKEINDTYGHQIGDQMLQDLARTLRQCVRATEGAGQSGDHLVRYGGEEFLLVMEGTNAQRAMQIAERIRQAIDMKNDWPGGIAKWTMSIGVSTYPADGKSADDLVLKADTALYYVKEELGRNKVCHAQQVPKQFKSAKQAAVVAGELGVFDPAALLQSLATSQKTGVLTVAARDGKQLWMLFENGKPVQARLGKFAGANAVVEFITTFDEGNFNFQEKVMTGKETMTKLPKLDESYNVSKALERCLMDGALAQDNYNAARQILQTSEMFVRPVPPLEFAARWQALGQLSEPPTQQEFDVMSAIVQAADGNRTLSAIFKEMDTIPTAVLWRGAALLVQHGLVQTKLATPV